MLKFYRFLLLPLTAVFLASTAGIARYAADSCTQMRIYRQLAAQTENFPGDAASPGNDFLPQYQALYTQNSDLAGWIQIDGTNINYPVMQSKQDPDFYLKHNFEKADSPHGCPYVQANCDLQTPSDNILVFRRYELERFHPSPDCQAAGGKCPHSHPCPLQSSE